MLSTKKTQGASGGVGGTQDLDSVLGYGSTHTDTTSTTATITLTGDASSSADGYRDQAVIDVRATGDYWAESAPVIKISPSYDGYAMDALHVVNDFASIVAKIAGTGDITVADIYGATADLSNITITSTSTSGNEIEVTATPGSNRTSYVSSITCAGSNWSGGGAYYVDVSADASATGLTINGINDQTKIDLGNWQFRSQGAYPQIRTQLNLQIDHNVSLGNGNAVRLGSYSPSTYQLTDNNAEQTELFVSSGIGQSGTACWYGVSFSPTISSEGDGSTGRGNAAYDINFPSGYTGGCSGGASAAYAFHSSINNVSKFHVGSDGGAASSGSHSFMSLTPTFNQSGTASYTGIKFNVTETGVGSGTTNKLLDMQVGGVSNVSFTLARPTTAGNEMPSSNEQIVTSDPAKVDLCDGDSWNYTSNNNLYISKASGIDGYGEIDIWRAPVDTVTGFLATSDSNDHILSYVEMFEGAVAHVNCKVIARENGGSDRASYELAGTFYMEGGIVNRQGAVTSLHTQESDATWSCSLEPGLHTVNVQINGDGDNIRWFSSQSATFLDGYGW